MLTKNPLLEEAAKFLSGMRPTARSFEIFASSHYSRQTPENALGYLGEASLNSHIEVLESKYHGRIHRPIRNAVETANYKFVPNGLGIKVKGRYTDYCEIDGLICVDGLTTLLEIKLNTNKKTNNKRRKKLSSGETLNMAMRIQHIEHVKKPLKELMGCEDIGYVIITYPSKITEASTSQQAFRKINGILVPFYADKQHFLEEASSSMVA